MIVGTEINAPYYIHIIRTRGVVFQTKMKWRIFISWFIFHSCGKYILWHGQIRKAHQFFWSATPHCTSGHWFNIKMSSYLYRKSHYGDKTVVRSSYLHNGISYTGKMASFYWISLRLHSQYTHPSYFILYLLVPGYVKVTAKCYDHLLGHGSIVTNAAELAFGFLFLQRNIGLTLYHPLYVSLFDIFAAFEVFIYIFLPFALLQLWWLHPYW